MLNGIIVNINSNRFKVLANDKEYICSARGKFRNDKIIPLVGDNVLFNENTLQIEKILERKNFLLIINLESVAISIISPIPCEALAFALAFVPFNPYVFC